MTNNIHFENRRSSQLCQVEIVFVENEIVLPVMMQIKGVVPVLEQVLKDPRKGGWVVNKCVWRLVSSAPTGRAIALCEFVRVCASLKIVHQLQKADSGHRRDSLSCMNECRHACRYEDAFTIGGCALEQLTSAGRPLAVRTSE